MILTKKSYVEIMWQVKDQFFYKQQRCLGSRPQIWSSNMLSNEAMRGLNFSKIL